LNLKISTKITNSFKTLNYRQVILSIELLLLALHTIMKDLIYRGHESPILLKLILMISEEHIKSIINNEIRNRNLFLVDLKMSSSNKINVFIDSMKGVTLEECAKLNFMIKEKLNKHIDDYVLKVSSPGLNKSLILPLQYEKNLGRYLDIITKDGKKTTGRLTKVTRNGIQIKSEVAVKDKPGRKRERVTKDYVFDFTDIKSAKVIVSFN